MIRTRPALPAPRKLPRPARVLRAVAVLGIAAVGAAAMPGVAAASLSCERLPELVKAYLQKHIRFHYLNDELRQRAIDSYVKRLDPSRSLLLIEDKVALAESLQGVFHVVRSGDCSTLVAIRDDMTKRYEQVQAFVEAFVTAEDYEIDSSVELIIDPDKRARPRTAAERNELYQRLVHFQMSNYLANGEELGEAKRKLVHRYELMTKRAKEMTEEDVYASFLDSFATALDPHSNYFTADAVEDFQIGMELSLEGIGVALSSRDGYSVVERIIPGGAADQLDVLEPSDKIIAVAQAEGDFVDIVDMDLRDVVRLIRGKRGTTVRLSILRQAENTERLLVSIVRDKIKLEDQAAALRFEEIEDEDGKTLKLAVLELPSFYGGRNPRERQSSRDIRQLLQEVKREKADGLLFDLSRNGGGLLENSVEIAGFFIREGGVVAVKDTFSKVEVLRDPDDSLVYDGPMVLLTSRASASASEIVAGAMKDYGRAILVGDDHTFGKGTVQSMVPLPKDLGALKVTTALFFRPGGSSTQHEGVEADIVFPSLYSASELGEKHQDYSLPAQRIDAFLEAEAVPGENTSDTEFWAPITPEVVRELADRSAKRVDQSKEFQEIRQQIKETEERNGVLHLSDIYKPGEKAEEKPEEEIEKSGEPEREAGPGGAADEDGVDGAKRGRDESDGDSASTDSASADSASIWGGDSVSGKASAAQPGNPLNGRVASTADNPVDSGELAQLPDSSQETDEDADASPPSPQQREALQILADFVRLQS